MKGLICRQCSPLKGMVNQRVSVVEKRDKCPCPCLLMEGAWLPFISVSWVPVPQSQIMVRCAVCAEGFKVGRCTMFCHCFCVLTAEIVCQSNSSLECHSQSLILHMAYLLTCHKFSQIPHFYYLRRRRLCFGSVCLSVCLSDNWKSCEQILTIFLGGLGHGPGTNEFNFGDDLDHRPDPGVWSPKSAFNGLSKKSTNGFWWSFKKSWGVWPRDQRCGVLIFVSKWISK